MEIFVQHKYIENENTLILYMDPSLTEFSKEFMEQESHGNYENLKESVKRYIKDKLPNVKVTAVKIMVGSMLLTTLTFALLQNEAGAASVAEAQALYQTGQNINIIINGQPYYFSQPVIVKDGTTYVPVREIAGILGADVWWNGETNTVGVNKGDIKIAFVVGENSARVNGNRVTMQPSFYENGKTMVPLRFISEALGMNVDWHDATKTIYISGNTIYTVKAGDSLWKIANSFGISISQIKTANKLTSDVIHPGQQLIIPAKGTTGQQTPAPGQTASPQESSVSYITYTIQPGDNMWDLSIRFGVPMTELLRVNNMTMDSLLSVGQRITVPVHKIGIKNTPGEKYGEYLDWWTEAQYVFTIGKVATVTDFQTGKQFKVKRTIGANHADCEPLTAKDAAIMKEIWGGTYSWTERAVIVEVDGRKLAASMSSMPHDIQYITDNNFNGHFDIHFANSTRHNDGKVTADHQRQVKIAAGLL